MSRAFVKEDDGTAGVADLPDRPISAHRNLVTADGLTRIDAEIADLRRRLASLTGARDPEVAALSRDLRYWAARRASAELVAPQAGDEIRFGATVTIERADGRRQTFRIVGEDEADPKHGTLSWVAPLARALIGRSVGDEVAFQDDTIVIVDQG